MFWGAKSRFHDLNDVVNVLNPKSVEFHLTDEDIKSGKIDGTHNLSYSIHLPEYWEQQIINPCNSNKLNEHLDIYRLCIEKGLSFKNNFIKEKMKVVIHPGGMTVDPIEENTDEIIGNLYKNIKEFVDSLPFKDDIEILIENMPPLPWFYGGQYYSNIFCDPKEIRTFCNVTGYNICLDISHLGLYCNYKKTNLLESINMLKPYVKQIHLADAEGTSGEGVPIGEGNVDFKAVMNEIKDLDIAVIPETMWGHKNKYAGFKQVIDVCSQYI